MPALSSAATGQQALLSDGQSPLRPAGPVAEGIAQMSWVLIAGASAVFLIVMLCVAAALWRRRAGPGTQPAPPTDTAAARRATRWWIVGAGTVFPLLVLVPLLLYAYTRTQALTLPQRGEGLVITVEAELWWWRIRYRDAAGGLEVVSANQIHLPVGRPVTLALLSDNVIHSFWVPALAGKVDMVPGRLHHLRLQASQPGVFRGQCAEFCGAQHARMALHVVAQPPEDFDRWLRAQAAPANTPRGGLALRGLAVFNERRCNACHSVRGLDTGAPGATLGPDLTHLAGRLHLGAGTLPFNGATLAAWIADPQHAKPGVRMPSYPLDAASMQALVAFLEQLR